MARKTRKASNREQAENPNTSPQTLTELAKDSDWHVRWRVAGNPSTPVATLIILLQDRDADVRQAALRRI